MDHEEDRQLNSDSEHEVPLRPDELEERRRQVEARAFDDDLDIDNVATIQHNLVASGADVGVAPPLEVGRQSPGNQTLRQHNAANNPFFGNNLESEMTNSVQGSQREGEGGFHFMTNHGRRTSAAVAFGMPSGMMSSHISAGIPEEESHGPISNILSARRKSSQFAHISDNRMRLSSKKKRQAKLKMLLAQKAKMKMEQGDPS